jgi:hypothetical protein
MVPPGADCAEARYKSEDHRRDRGRSATIRHERRSGNLLRLSIELDRKKRISDVAYDRAVKCFGEVGVLEIAGINGYYTSLAMTMNTTRYAIPADGKRLLRWPD